MKYILTRTWRQISKKFDIIGFSMSLRNSTGRRNAFNRSHVFAAVLQNLKKLKEVDYNENIICILWCLAPFFRLVIFVDI